MKTPRPTYIVGGKRTPFTKSMTKYLSVSSKDLMSAPLKALVESFNLKDVVVGDVALGAVMQSSGNWNLAREVVLGAGLHPYTPAYNVQRACGTSLETTLQLALKISNHQIDTAIAGGVDSNSDAPIEVSGGLRDLLIRLNAERSTVGKLKLLTGFRPAHLLPKIPAVVEPRTGLSMGEHCEKMVQQWNIPREEQDKLALQSHKNAARAYETGFYEDLVIPFQGLMQDTTVRGDTSLEKLAKLKPAFDPKGSLTAGNSSPLTDGAAASLLCSEEALKKFNWTPLALFVDAEVAALDFVRGDGLLMAPTVAVARLLARNGLKLQDFDIYEIHEAFAGQVLCTLRAWESADYCKKYMGLEKPLGSFDLSKMNPKGGSVALGHPFAATGARIVATLAKELFEAKKGRGLISICTAGGMGVAAILEAV